MCRHGYAVMRLSSGAQLIDIQKELRHRSIESTLNLIFGRIDFISLIPLVGKLSDLKLILPILMYNICIKHLKNNFIVSIIYV